MKILIISPTDLNKNSGSQVRARLIIQGLEKAGVELAVVSSGIPPEIGILGIEKFLLGSDRACVDTCREAARNFLPDYIYSITEAYPEWAFEAAKVNGAKVGFDLHAIGFLEVLDLGKGYGPRLQRIKNSMKWLTRIRHADIITLCTPTMYGVAKKIFNRSIVVPPFGMTDTDHFSPEGETRSLGMDPTKKQVLYIGNYYKWQGIQLLLKSIQIILTKNSQFEFSLVGTIGMQSKVDEIRARYKAYPSIHFLDSVSYDIAPSLMRSADILIVPRPMMLSTYYAIPQKLGDYMATGRLIIATNLASHRWALQSPPCGVLCRPNAKAVADAIMKEYDAKLSSSYRENARAKAVADFDYRRQTLKIINAFK